ncbi:MAG: hypothetical protein EAZ08_14075 [Cytophagales bacterium]|nr:MAG: hypothetical protein EAZ08_14075 [Cytophagales bacterium]
MKKVAIILRDIEKLNANESVSLAENEELINYLSYTPFKQYLLCLKVGVKPEEATAILLKHIVEDLFEKTPFAEMRTHHTLGSTALQETVYQPVILIGKPLFKMTRDEKGDINGIKRDILQYENYKNAISTYLNENTYVILTNFNEVLIFDKEAKHEFEPLQTLSFVAFMEVSKDKDSLFTTAQSLEKPPQQEVILKQFTKTIQKLAGDKKINELLFCKFIEAHQLVPYQFLKQLFFEHKRIWERQGENFIFDKFTNTLSDWLIEHYAFNFSENNSLDFPTFEKLFLAKTEKIKNFDDYDYYKISEYTLCKAFENLYETNNNFPEEVYDKLCEVIVGQLFENQVTKIIESIEKGNLKKAKQLFGEVQKKTMINSFIDTGLVFSKLLKLIFRQCQRIEKQIDIILNEKQNLLDRDENWNKLFSLKNEFGFDDLRKFITNIIKNQLFIDFANSPNAQHLTVARLTAYITAIRLAPSAFAFRKPTPQEERDAFKKFDMPTEPTSTFAALVSMIQLADWKKEGKILISKFLSQVVDNGLLCFAIPANLLFGGAEVALRQLILVENTVKEIVIFEQNKISWALLTIQKKEVEKKDIFTLDYMHSLQENKINYANSLISGFSPDLFCIIKFNETIDYQICSKMRVGNSTFAENGYLFKNEFKFSNDTTFFLRSAEENTLPLYEGRAVDSYLLSDDVKYFVPKEKAHNQLLSKEINTLKKEFGLSQKNYEIVGIFHEKEFLLDYQCERLVVKKTLNDRHHIFASTLLPANAFAEGSLLYLSNLRYEKTNKDLIQNTLPKEERLFLLALLNSWVLNFYAATIGLEDISFLPLPKIKSDKGMATIKEEITEKAFQILHHQDTNAEIRFALESQIANALYRLNDDEFAHVCKKFQR